MTIQYDVSRLTPEQLQGMLRTLVALNTYVDWVETDHLEGDLCPMRNEADGFMFEALGNHAHTLFCLEIQV